MAEINILPIVREIPQQAIGFAKNTLTPESAWTEEESKTRAKDRSIARNAQKSILSRYDGIEDPMWETELGKKDLQKLKEYDNLLKGELEISFDELTWDKKFLRDVRAMHKAEMGYDFSGNNYQLKDYAFSRFNSMEQNIGVTASNLLLDNMFYTDFDLPSLHATQDAYKVFSEIDWTGKGSRNFASQIIDFGQNTVADPFMYGTGYTVGWLAKGARLLGKKAFTKSVVNSMASAIGKKQASFKGISDTASSLVGMSAYTGTLGSIQSANIQNAQIDLDARDNFSVGEMAAAGVLSATLPVALTGASTLLQKVSNKKIPVLNKGVNSMVGNLQRALKKPFFTAYGRDVMTLEGKGGTVKGKEAAFIGTVQNLEKNIVVQNATKSANKDFYNTLTDDVINPMNEKISNGYNNLSYRGMNKTDMVDLNKQVQAIIKQNKDNPSFSMSGEIKQLYDLLVPLDKIKAKKAAIKKYEKAMLQYNKDVREYKIAVANGTQLMQIDERAGADAIAALVIPKRPKKPNIGNPETDDLLTNKNIEQVLKQIRNAIYDTSQGYRNTGNNATAKAWEDMYDIFKTNQRSYLANAGDKLAWDSLQIATADFKTALHKLPIGKKFEKILQYNKLADNARAKGSTNNADAFDQQAIEESGNLINYIINEKNSLGRLKQFESVLLNIDKRTNNLINARSGNKLDAMKKDMQIALTKQDFTAFPELKQLTGVKSTKTKDDFINSYAKELMQGQNSNNGSYNKLLEVIKASLGRKLENEGTESISKILAKDDGFELLGHIFPNARNDLLNIQKLGQYLDENVAPKHSQSVIVNMTVARAAQDIGTTMVGEKGSGGFVLSAFYGMQRWRNLTSNKVFQKAMADAINNNGRLPTKTQLKLEKRLGFDEEAIRALQDGISNIILVQRPAIKNQENIKRKAKRMMQ